MAEREFPSAFAPNRKEPLRKLQVRVLDITSHKKARGKRKKKNFFLPFLPAIFFSDVAGNSPTHGPAIIAKKGHGRLQNGKKIGLIHLFSTPANRSGAQQHSLFN